MKRKIKASKQKEESHGCKYFREEIGGLLSHVCFKCGTMGPVLREESFQMTFVGSREDGLELWRCSRCSNECPSFDEVRQMLMRKGETLSSGGNFQERELKAVILPCSGKVVFLPSKLAEGFADGLYDGPAFSSVVLVPSLPPAIETIIQECDNALEAKTELDNYVEDLLRRPIITDFQDFLSCLYRSMEANVRSTMARIFKAISTIARGEILSTNPNMTNASKKNPHLRMTVEGALQQVCLII